MMESGDLYSLSNSTADESSNKSDSSIGQGFDNPCAYQDYDRSSELDLIGNFKYTEDEGLDPDKPRKSHKDDKGLDLENKKKSADVGATSAMASETCPSGLAVQRQMNIAKSKGLFNIFSSNVDPEVLYRPPELPMKASPPTSAYYKNKRFQHFKDEFTLNLSRQNALSHLPDKNGNENQKLDGYPFNNRLMKDVNLANLQREQDKIDPMTEHARDVLSGDKIVSFERLRGGSLVTENPPAESITELRHLHEQSTSRLPNRFEALNFERMKHGSFIAKDEGSTSIRSSMTREAFMTHLQQTHPQQQHQQQQAKSFTIDAILGLRNNQRDKHRAQQFRKGQDDSQGKHSSADSCSGNSNGGKLKRVRTIFTAEQLERLEGEFSRQQYMVGPERLYLAHALRLTEAQVKVWFQNRRIKWRKLNHEQQSQRLHELHQRSLSSLEHEDSNETGEW